MKLSIITVNRNNKDGLEKTIRSVIRQTSHDYEYIIIDGASTDGSPEIIRNYEENITYWISEPDTGIYNAMNKGIRKAQGDYCLFLNSGDWLYEKDVLEKIAHHLDMKTPIISCRIMRDDAPEGILARKYYNLFTALSVNFPHQATFIQRSLFNIFGMYDESYKIRSDSVFFFKTVIMNKVPFSIIEIPVAFFDGNGISSSNSKLLQAEFRAFLFHEAPLYLTIPFLLKELLRIISPSSLWNFIKKFKHDGK